MRVNIQRTAYLPEFCRKDKGVFSENLQEKQLELCGNAPLQFEESKIYVSWSSCAVCSFEFDWTPSPSSTVIPAADICTERDG